jgi:rhodanese-related sulfurtransferase
MGPENVIAYADETKSDKRHPDDPAPPGQPNVTPEELATIVSAFASDSTNWLERVRLCARHRWYERVYHGPQHDIWILSWLPGQSTGFHDHGNSAGAFIVATGFLEEIRPGGHSQTVGPGQYRTFGHNYAHDVRNLSLAPAISIHAYSPPLDEMNEYELDGDQLVPRAIQERNNALASEWRIGAPTPLAQTNRQTIEQLLATARMRLQRLSPGAAYEATAHGAILVDIRPAAQRAHEGAIPGSQVIERNVLEWRLDPASSARLPFATSHDIQVIVFCSEGYTSSLAAASLQDIGLEQATDIAGGYHAWRAAGLPILPSIDTT